MFYLRVRDICSVDYLCDHRAPKNPDPNNQTHGILLGVEPGNTESIDSLYFQVFNNLIDEINAVAWDMELPREEDWNQEFGENTDILLSYARDIDPDELTIEQELNDDTLIWFELTWD